MAAVPDNLPLEQAGGVPLVALTAWQALHSASAKSGQRILILAASGSVGHLAVQLAKNLGLYVVGTASAKNLDLVRNFGADEAVDYAGGAADLRARYGGSDETKFDIVLDLVGGETLEVAAAELLRAGGAIAHVQNAGTDHAANAKHAAAAAAGGPRWATILVQPSGAQLEELARLIGEGKLRLHIAKSFPLSEVRRRRTSLPLPPRDAPARRGARAPRVSSSFARRLDRPFAFRHSYAPASRWRLSSVLRKAPAAMPVRRRTRTRWRAPRGGMGRRDGPVRRRQVAAAQELVAGKHAGGKVVLTL